MRRLTTHTEALVLRWGYGLAGLILTAAAVLAAGLAREHMALLGAMCGAGSHPHCGWCYGAAGLGLAALAAFARALNRPAPVTRC